MKNPISKTLNMVYTALFAVIIAICSWISIPTTVPFSMQTFGVFAAVAVLGGRRGTMSVLIFILLGAVGVPVFTGFRGGLGVLLGNTGGYILGFLLSALLMWGMERLFGRKLWIRAVSMILGMIVYYTFGTAWFMFVYAEKIGEIGLMTALGWCVFPFIIPDILKAALALAVSKRLAGVFSIDERKSCNNQRKTAGAVGGK